MSCPDEKIRFRSAKAEPLLALRHASSKVRSQAVGLLQDQPRVFRFLEAARLLRDRNAKVRSDALSALREIEGGADGVFRAMMIRDLAPHAWHFTDHPDTLAWLDGLAAQGEANSNTKALQSALKGIAKYNADRGLK